VQRGRLFAVATSILIIIVITFYFTEIFASGEPKKDNAVVTTPPTSPMVPTPQTTCPSCTKPSLCTWVQLPPNEHTRKESTYQKDITRRNDMLERFHGMPIWTHFPPLWRCESEERIGYPIGSYPGDGHKWVCAEVVNQEKCLIYSIGVNGEVSFDQEAKLRWPNCEIHAFDTDSSSAPKLEQAGVIFHPEYVTDIMETMTKYNHVEKFEWIDILKVDIEGGEWNIIPAALKKGVKFKQLQVELHSPNKIALKEWFTLMESYHYRVFHQDANYYCGPCMEYSLVYYDPNHPAPWLKKE